MFNDPQKIIDRVIWAILSAAAAMTMRFLVELNDNLNELTIQLSKNTMQLQYHESELKTLTDSNSVLFRIEGQLGYHEKRITKLEEMKENEQGNK